MHRHATLADIDAVYAIYMDENTIPYLGFDSMPRTDFLPVMEKLVASQSFYVVEREGSIQGFYRISRHEGRARHVAYLGTLAVSPEARGTGLARSMVETAIARLHAEGVVRIELMLEADNPRALNFYRKLGFEREGTMRCAYKRSSDAGYVDELFMAKLSSPMMHDV
jgi:putative acetyltransferase